MTIEEITQALATVAENQAKHSADIAEIDRMLAASLQSQDRYDEQLAAVREIMHDLADKHLKNEERFAETDNRFAQLADAQIRYEARQEMLEASYELFEGFVREFRNETNQRLDGQDEADVQTESRLDALIDAQIQLTHRVDTLTGDIAALNGRVDRIGEHLDQVAALQTENAAQIKALLDRNGSATTPKAKVRKAKKVSKKGSAK